MFRRESKEFYSSGEEADIGTYENLLNHTLVRIRRDGDPLPEEPDGRVIVYARISGDPDWDPAGAKAGALGAPEKQEKEE